MPTDNNANFRSCRQGLIEAAAAGHTLAAGLEAAGEHAKARYARRIARGAAKLQKLLVERIGTARLSEDYSDLRKESQCPSASPKSSPATETTAATSTAAT